MQPAQQARAPILVVEEFQDASLRYFDDIMIFLGSGGEHRLGLFTWPRRLRFFTPPQASPASQPQLQASASTRSAAYPLSAEPASWIADANAIVLAANEQKSRDTASPQAVSGQLTVGAIQPQQADETARLTIAAQDAGPNAAAGSADRSVLSRAESKPGAFASMMKSGAQLLANGDTSGARLMYQRLAEKGEALAGLALADTYDPQALRQSSITGGVTPDVALGQSWHEKAKALGSRVAAERVETLTRLDRVTFTTDFGYYGRNAYFFVALDRGYYRDAGLEVKIVRGQGDADAIRQIGAGNAMFGFADLGNLILARANDQIPVKLVAITYRKPPQAIFCREDSGLRKPKDLEGNAIGTTAGASVPTLFPAFAKAAGIDARTVRWVLASIESLPVLLATNKVSCGGQFTPGEALLRSQYGPGKLVRFAYSDAGLTYYGSGIVATDATIASKPDLVRRFIAATIRGMEDAFADPATAGAIMQKIVPQVDATVAKKETEAVAELAHIPGQPLGEIDPARIEATVDVVKGAFQLATPVAAADVYAPGFGPK
jgi:NitT/TauT family transport system substrate-binding protein